MYEIICGDALEVLKGMADESVNCCVTSPPYYALRDYGVDGQIGLENTPEEFIAKLVDVFREVKRVLRNDGTLWVNIGDSYAGSGKCAWSKKDAQKECYVPDPESPVTKVPKKYDGIKSKDMIGIPWMLAFALRADGWYLRQDIIWAKPNPMPESVTDRCTKSHEYIFLLAKSTKYHFDSDAIKENSVSKDQRPSALQRAREYGYNTKDSVNPAAYRKRPTRYGGKKYTADPNVFNRTKSENAYDYRPLRNKRDVWTVSTHPFRGAHFAVFPEKLITPCVLSGCQEGGTILDPFSGSGTTGLCCVHNGRNYIGIELNPEYAEMSKQRLEEATEQASLFNPEPFAWGVNE